VALTLSLLKALPISTIVSTIVSMSVDSMTVLFWCHAVMLRQRMVSTTCMFLRACLYRVPSPTGAVMREVVVANVAVMACAVAAMPAIVRVIMPRVMFITVMVVVSVMVMRVVAIVMVVAACMPVMVRVISRMPRDSSVAVPPAFVPEQPQTVSTQVFSQRLEIRCLTETMTHVNQHTHPR